MDPTTELRIKNLEQKFEKIEGLLSRLEVKVTEFAATSAKAQDLQKVHIDLAEVKGVYRPCRPGGC